MGENEPKSQSQADEPKSPKIIAYTTVIVVGVSGLLFAISTMLDNGKKVADAFNKLRPSSNSTQSKNDSKKSNDDDVLIPDENVSTFANGLMSFSKTTLDKFRFEKDWKVLIGTWSSCLLPGNCYRIEISDDGSISVPGTLGGTLMDSFEYDSNLRIFYKGLSFPNDSVSSFNCLYHVYFAGRNTVAFARRGVTKRMNDKCLLTGVLSRER